MALLDVKELSVHFGDKNTPFKAVDRISYQVAQGEVLGIVGESGSGKSVSSLAIMGLIDHPGRVSAEYLQFENTNLLTLESKAKRQLIGADVAMIFQDPLASLNPLMTIAAQIDEALYYHTKLNKEERQKRVLELLDQVGIVNPERTARQYPHELSGGMRQRVIIAIALACKPPIIIADEPTTALDVTIQAQILDLMNDIQKETEAGIILITHDLGVVAETADRVAVMYAGQFVEIAPVEELFNNPQHPYTRSLLRSIPQTSELEGGSDKLHVIQGAVPPLTKMIRTGCRFAPRIPWIAEDAHEENPGLHEVSPGHFVRCTCYKHFHFEGEEN